MKPIVIVLFVINLGVFTPANTIVNVENHVFKVGYILVDSPYDIEIIKKSEISANNNLVCLYKLKEYRIMKALTFTPQIDKPLLV
ncbi:hypothetical protein ZORO111903_20035 [Zobellia roscoffensis]|uniref:hypothetical protein n=1 Tax=Zobellia roscoffensis TaxID=2779508 RepID=UPI00188AF2D8|nr:hypothetical protein [Zobellia roscoffensis]